METNKERPNAKFAEIILGLCIMHLYAFLFPLLVFDQAKEFVSLPDIRISMF